MYFIPNAQHGETSSHIKIKFCLDEWTFMHLAIFLKVVYEKTVQNS
jgi:hypothetical protein